MRVRQLLVTATGVVMTLGAVTGCDAAEGDSTTDDYCSSVKSMKGGFDDLSADGESTLKDLRHTVDDIGDIADKAPDDINDSWTSVYHAMDKIVGLLEDAGIDSDKPLDEAAEDFMRSDRAGLRRFVRRLQRVNDRVDGVQRDTKKITAEVDDACGIDLDGASND